MRRSASGHFCFISPSISLSQDFPPWPMLNGSVLKKVNERSQSLWSSTVSPARGKIAFVPLMYGLNSCCICEWPKRKATLKRRIMNKITHGEFRLPSRTRCSLVDLFPGCIWSNLYFCIAKVCFAQCSMSRLALGSPGCLFVCLFGRHQWWLTMPKIAFMPIYIDFEHWCQYI